MGAVQLATWVLNGGPCFCAPPQATCQAVGGGQRVCTCPPGYGGDGFGCYGDIFRVSGSLCRGRGPLMHLRWEGAVRRSLGGGGRLGFVPKPMASALSLP